MDVNQLHEELTQLIAEGYGEAPVLFAGEEVEGVWRGSVSTNDGEAKIEVWLAAEADE